MNINKETKLQDLLANHEWLKAELPKINSNFERLNDPAKAEVMLPVATVEMMAVASDMDVNELIAKLEELIAAHK